MKFDIRQSVKDHKILLTAHRGVNGGNIPCNSLECYRIARNLGADVIEVDVTASADGELFMLHPGMEPVHFAEKGMNIGKLPASEVKKIFLANQDLTKTQYPVVTFDEMLEEVASYPCYINVDKFWDNPAAISEKIRRHGMTDRILVKTSTDKRILDMVEKYAPDMQFMGVTRDAGAHEDLKRRDINYIGLEVIFDKESDEVASDEFIAKLHAEGYVLFVNSIVYNYRDVLSAGHNDDVAMLGDPDYGWGWLAEKKFDMIQTDWLTQCDNYLRSKGYRK